MQLQSKKTPFPDVSDIKEPIFIKHNEPPRREGNKG